MVGVARTNVGLVSLLVDQHDMALAEGPAPHILPAQPHIRALRQQRACIPANKQKQKKKKERKKK